MENFIQTYLPNVYRMGWSGQVKITGKIDKNLLELALKSLNRIDRLNRLIWNWNKKEPTYYIETMRKDLQKYKEDF